MKRFKLSRRPHTRKRRDTVRLELELLESRSLPSTTSPFSGALDLVLAGKVTPADFKNPPSPIGTNPYSNAANVNTDTPGDGGAESAPHNETTIAVNPTNPLNLVASANDYQAIPGNHGVYVTNFIRAHVTFDGGHTWTEYPVPFKGYNAASDPAVSFDADGTAYLSTLGYVHAENFPSLNSSSLDILVAHSTDGGITWSTQVRVANGAGFPFGNGQSTYNDKPYLTAWGHGNAIVTWTQYHFGPTGVGPDHSIDGPVMASVTHDGGNTWTDPVSISGPLASTYGPNFYYFNTFSVPAVGPDGSIYVAYTSNDNEVAPDFRNHYMVVKLDPATGQPLANFHGGSPVEVGLIYDGIHDYPISVDGRQTLQDSEFRVQTAGNITVDPTNAKHLAVIWSDMRDSTSPLASSDPYQVKTNADIIVSQSLDGGQTWTLPTALKAAGDQFQPWGAYNTSGLLQIGYYDRSYDPVNHRYGYTLASETTAGSLNFTTQQVTTVLSDPTQGDFIGFAVTVNPNFPLATTFMGDYSGIAVVSPTLVATLWTDMRLPSSTVPGSNEDAFFALVDPPAGGSGGATPTLVSAAAADTEAAALLASESSWKGLAVDAYFRNLARTSQTTSSITESELAKMQPTFASSGRLTRALVTPRGHPLAAPANDLLESLFAEDKLFVADLAAI
jgi:hypothetical protein